MGDVPCSKTYLTVGRAATILWLLLILPSAKGTLKSTLARVSFGEPGGVPDQGALALEADVGDGKFVEAHLGCETGAGERCRGTLTKV